MASSPHWCALIVAMLRTPHPFCYLSVPLLRSHKRVMEAFVSMDPAASRSRYEGNETGGAMRDLHS